MTRRIFLSILTICSPSFELLMQLKLRIYTATGTNGENRMKRCPITMLRVVKKQPRGSYDWFLDTNKDILVFRWAFNSVVTGFNLSWYKPCSITLSDKIFTSPKEDHTSRLWYIGFIVFSFSFQIRLVLLILVFKLASSCLKTLTNKLTGRLVFKEKYKPIKLRN